MGTGSTTATHNGFSNGDSTPTVFSQGASLKIQNEPYYVFVDVTIGILFLTAGDPTRLRVP